MIRANSPRLKKRTVLITGATSGIGLEVVKLFAEHGWDLVCHYNRSSPRVDIIRDVVRSQRVGCTFFKTDFSSQSQLNVLVKRLDSFHVDSLINNAATYVSQKHFSDLRLDEVKKTFMINLFSALMISGKVFQQMKKKKFGRIVNISSIAAKYGGSSCSLPYGCSKLGLEGLTKTLAKEGANFNILVNTVRPGVIDTEFHKKFPKDMISRIKMIPLKRMGKPEEVARTIYYLGSDENTFITNETLAISGGE